MDISEITKLTMSMVLQEKSELAKLQIEYETEINNYVIGKKPATETEYNLCIMEAENKYNDLKKKMLLKEAEIESHQDLLNHKEEVLAEYKKFMEDHDDLEKMMEILEQLRRE